MIITGIAHPPVRLHERNQQPSLELTFLAVRALQTYGATGLITHLASGWELALAKAALELEIPCAAPLLSPAHELVSKPGVSSLYEELLSQSIAANKVLQLKEIDLRSGDHRWRVDRADLILALWDYGFQGETYAIIEYALQNGKTVVNLWQDWESLLSLRKVSGLPEPLRKRGAKIYEAKKIA